MSESVASTQGTQQISPRIPLVIGVTGHRNLRPEDVPALERAVGQLIDDLKSKCPNTPITIISALAEGADRLVARVGLKHGASLVAMFPMPRRMFETDFKSEVSRREFEQLADAAQNVIELALPTHVTEAEASVDGEARDARYAEGGVMVDRSSHILLALWDGEPAAGTGGTGDAVAFMLEGPPPRFQGVSEFLHPPSTGPVAHVYTPRPKSPNSNQKAGELSWRYPSAARWRRKEKELDRRLKLIEKFNVEAAQGSGYSLLPDEVWRQGIDNQAAEILDARYQAADRLARVAQNRAKRVYRWLSGFGVFALSFYQLNSNHQTHWGGYLVLFAVVMIGAAIVYYLAKKERLHERYLDDRALAEAIRVQFFWALAGIKESVLDYMPLRLHDDLGWLRTGLADFVIPPRVDESASAEKSLQIVQKHWVQDQLDFFISRATKRQVQVAQVSTLKTVLVMLGLATLAFSTVLKRSLSGLGIEHDAITLATSDWAKALLLILALMIGVAGFVVARKRIAWLKARKPDRRGGTMPYILLAVAGVILIGITVVLTLRGSPQILSATFILSATVSIIGPVIAGVIQAYGGHFAFAEHLRRYATMAALFGRAERAIHALLARRDIANVRTLLFHLGHESLSESTEWLVMHRERPIPLIRPKSSVDSIFQRESSDVMLSEKKAEG